MFRLSLRLLVLGVAAAAGALTIGMGAAQAKPVNPCVISPQACNNSPPVKVDPCVIDPSLCPPPPTQPQPKPPSQPGNGSRGGTGNGSASAGGPGSGTPTVADAPPAVHRASHTTGGGSGNGLLVLGASGALAASLAGLAGLAVWRRRAVA
jgi:hypothetical protein